MPSPALDVSRLESLLGDARLTGLTVRMEAHNERAERHAHIERRAWAEVRADRPHNSQVAHCADDEDAALIVELVNQAPALIAAVRRVGEMEEENARLKQHIRNLVDEGHSFESEGQAREAARAAVGEVG